MLILRSIGWVVKMNIMIRILSILSLLLALHTQAQVVVYSGSLTDNNYAKLNAVSNVFEGYITADSIQYSVPFAKASAYIVTPVGTNTTTAGQYYFLQGTFGNSFAVSFGTVGDTLQYQNGSGKILTCNFHFSLTSDKNTSTVTVAIFVNNTANPALISSTLCKTAGDVYDVAAMGLLRLNNGDKIKIMVKSDVANSVTTATQGSTTLYQIN